ncbi:MAG: hypothetical protein ACRDJV_11495 [Actinomycetota bacterium]
MPEASSMGDQGKTSRRGLPGRGPAIIAWTACAVALGALIGGAVLEEINRHTGISEGAAEHFGLLVGFGALPAMGALVASRHPRNPIGWMFLAVGVGIGILLLSAEYAHWALVERSGYHPGATLAAWFEQWLWAPSIGLIPTLILLLFPNGRPPSPRWRWLVWASAVTIGVVAVGGMIEARLEGHGYSIDNPIGIPGVGDVEATFAPVFNVFLALVPLCATSLVVRFRRARGDERQQLKLLTFSACLMVVGIILGDFLGVPGTLAVSLLLVSASVAVSMLKYRLYEIDRVINKTMVYGALTGLLVAGYAGGVLLLQTVLPLPNDSPAAVAASTLAMAALFRPLRNRIQTLVDRRFHRATYNAVRIIEVFAGNLRRQTDLDNLTQGLVAVVHRTVKPQHVSVWLMEAKEKSS